MAAAAVRVEGLSAFRRALRKADIALDAEVRAGFFLIAREAAGRAQDIARSKGLSDSGDLIRGMRPYARQRDIGVRSVAEHRGFQYPRRLEYESRGGGRYGPRASMNPAAEELAPTLEAESAAVLEAVLRQLSARGAI